MSEFRTASRYAKSILSLAKEKGVLEDMNKDMILVDNTIESSRDLALALKSPIIPHYKKLDVIEALFQTKLSELSNQFFTLIVRKGREKLIAPIVKEFRRQYLIHKGIQKVTVTTTFELDNSLREELEAVSKEISGMTPQLEEVVDSSIIGGFVLTLGDKRIDSSIKSKLKKLEKELAN